VNKLISFVPDYSGATFSTGGTKFYSWMGFLAVLSAIALYGFYLQNTEGLIVTGLTSQIHDGLYFANLVFLVGVAAGAVTIVFPAYIYHNEAMHKVSVLGEMLAISAVVMVMLFVFAHMGRPDRLWHMIPYIGIYNLPGSMLALGRAGLERLPDAQLCLRLLLPLCQVLRHRSEQKIFMPLIYISIVWALSIHTVTAFLIATMPARPCGTTA
jgi:Ni/Fe-hydrogenase subunit HybB-like protein